MLYGDNISPGQLTGSLWYETWMIISLYWDVIFPGLVARFFYYGIRKNLKCDIWTELTGSNILWVFPVAYLCHERLVLMPCGLTDNNNIVWKMPDFSVLWFLRITHRWIIFWKTFWAERQRLISHCISVWAGLRRQKREVGIPIRSGIPRSDKQCMCWSRYNPQSVLSAPVWC